MRSDIIKKNKLDISIHPLMEDIDTILTHCKENNFNIESTCLVLVPEVSSALSKKIPEKKKRFETISKIVECNLSQNYKLINCINPLTQQPSNEYFLLSLDSKENLELFYNLQPLNELFLIHKLTHPLFLPMLRKENFKSLCLNCYSEKSAKCIHELCEQCCIKQLRTENPILKLLPVCFPITRSIQTNTCSKCDNPTIVNQNNFNCIHRLCAQCCKLQLFTNKICILHFKSSAYVDNLNKFKDFGKFVESYQLRLSQIKIKLFESLKNGDFTWFRPIGNTDITRQTLDMNKELTIVMDNPNFRRENPLKLTDKMYKLFAFQVYEY
jgi:hypothetical protein